jgi:hypothetical protein
MPGFNLGESPITSNTNRKHPLGKNSYYMSICPADSNAETTKHAGNVLLNFWMISAQFRSNLFCCQGSTYSPL